MGLSKQAFLLAWCFFKMSVLKNKPETSGNMILHYSMFYLVISFLCDTYF